MGQTNPSQSNEKVENNTFSQLSVLEHIQQSYTLGCSQAYKAQGMKKFYSHCKNLGQEHAQEVRKMIETEDSQ